MSDMLLANEPLIRGAVFTVASAGQATGRSSSWTLWWFVWSFRWPPSVPPWSLLNGVGAF